MAHEHITFRAVRIDHVHLVTCGRCFALVHESDCEDHARYHGDVVSWESIDLDDRTTAYGAL